MEERKLDARESMELISRMIQNTRNRLENHAGRPFLVWGYTTVGIALLNYWFNIAGCHPAWCFTWFLIPIIGCLLMRLFPDKKPTEPRTPNPLREKDAGKGRIINAATSLRINVPSDSTLQPSNKGPRKIYLNQYTALRSESDRQCSDVSRALPRKKFRVNPASNNGPQNCGYRRIQKKRSHIIP